MTISAPLPTSPNNVEDQSSVSKPDFSIVPGGGGEGTRQEYFSNEAYWTRFEQSVPGLMARVVPLVKNMIMLMTL